MHQLRRLAERADAIVSAYTYQIHPDLNLIEVRWSGVTEMVDIMEYGEEILRRDLLTEGVVEYADLSGVTKLNGDYAGAQGLTGLLREWIARGWIGSVFHTPQDHCFGMTRMVGTILEGVQDVPKVRMIPRREPTALGDVREFLALQGQSE